MEDHRDSATEQPPDPDNRRRPCPSAGDTGEERTPKRACSQASSTASFNPTVSSYSRGRFAQSVVSSPDFIRGSRAPVFLDDREREVLPRTTFQLSDGRDSVDIAERRKVLVSTTCSLLINPNSYDINASHDLLPSEFSWQKFIEAAGDHVRFEAGKTVFYTTLYKDGQVIGSGMMGHKGEFGQAVGLMLEMTGRSPNPVQEARQYQIRWELRDGDPFHDRYETFAEIASVGAARDGSQENDTNSSQPPSEPSSSDSGKDTRQPSGDVAPEGASSQKKKQEVIVIDSDDDGGERVEKKKEQTMSDKVGGMMPSDIDDQLWPAACKFFNHDPARNSVKKDQVAVLGAKQTLLLYQAVYVYRYFLLVTDPDENVRRQGALFALSMGVGKTRIYQAIALVLRQAHALMSSFTNLDEDEGEMDVLHGGEHPACARDRQPGQIPCPHDCDSLTHRIATSALAASVLVVTPANVNIEAIHSAREFFAETIPVRMGNVRYDYPGMRVVAWRETVNGCKKTRETEAQRKFRALAKANFEWRGDDDEEVALDASNRLLSEAAFVEHVGELGDKLAFTPGTDINGVPPSSLFLIATRPTIGRASSWSKPWSTALSCDAAGGGKVVFNISCATCFGLVVVDEVQEFRSTDANQALVLLDCFKKQIQPPLVALLSGSPITDGLADLTFPFALIKGLWRQKPPNQSVYMKRTRPQPPDDIGDLRKKLRQLDSKLHAGASAADNEEIAAALQGYFYRNGDSFFLNQRILDQTPSYETVVECSIGDEFLPAITKLTAQAGTVVVKRLQAAMEADKNVDPKTLENILLNDPNFRDVKLATEFPGYALVLADGHDITTLSEKLAPLLSKQKGPEPRQYFSSLPDDTAPHIDTILRPCARLTKLTDFLWEAFNDRTPYPDVQGPWAGYSGPKNVVVLTESPVSALWLKCFLEKRVDDTRFKSALIHGAEPMEERYDAQAWFGAYREDDGSFKEYTKILVSTYDLIATGLDGLKVGNFEAQYTVIANHSQLRQAAARIQRRGQPLPTFVRTFQSSEYAADKATVMVRDKRARQFGVNGFLEKVSELIGRVR